MSHFDLKMFLPRFFLACFFEVPIALKIADFSVFSQNLAVDQNMAMIKTG